MPSPSWHHPWLFSCCSGPFSCCSGPFSFLNFHSKWCCLVLVRFYHVLLFFMHPFLSPLLDTLGIGLGTGVWLIIASLWAPSIVTCAIDIALWLMYEVSAFLWRLTTWRWPSVVGLPESPLCAGAWIRWVTSVWKGYLWFLFTSASGELWLHTHLTQPSFVTSLNISSALLYFLLLPFLPPKLTAWWWALGFSSKLLLVRGLLSSNLYFYKRLQ